MIITTSYRAPRNKLFATHDENKMNFEKKKKKLKKAKDINTYHSIAREMEQYPSHALSRIENGSTSRVDR